MESDENVHHLVLPQFVADRRMVLEPSGEAERCCNSHFLFKTTPGSGEGGLAGTRMTAAGIAPQAARMILRCAASLQQHSAGAVEDEHRNGTVPHIPPVGDELSRGTERPVLGVNEDDVFFVQQ